MLNLIKSITTVKFIFQDDIVGSLTYSYKIAMQYIEQRKFRDEVLEELVSLYQGLETPDYVNMCQCLIHLDKPHEVASILDKLIKNDSLKSEAMVCWFLFGVFVEFKPKKLPFLCFENPHFAFQ